MPTRHDGLLDNIPDPCNIRKRLAELTAEKRHLRRLLKLAEQMKRECPTPVAQRPGVGTGGAT